MIALQIEDVKHFMNLLLLSTPFDSFLLVEGSVKAGVTYHLDGTYNLEFYDQEKQADLKAQQFCSWQEQRNLVFSMIKGNRTPLSFKFVLKLSKKATEDFIDSYHLPLSYTDVNGLFFNILFDHNQLSGVTGVSYSIFTLDKKLDTLFDEFAKKFLSQHQIPYIEK